MSKGRITIKDIARELNISASTVSRALKDHPDISKKTIDAVHELANRYNYTPNTLAINLKHSRSNNIGVSIPKISHLYFASVIEGIEEYAEQKGYNIFVMQADENMEKEKKNIDVFIKGQVAGVLCSFSKTTQDFDHFQNLKENNIPLVFFDRVCHDIESSSVTSDDLKGAFSAVSHMIKTGCKNIAILHSPVHLNITENRINGYTLAYKQAGMEVDERLIILCDTRGKALKIVPKLLKKFPDIDGIFAVNDMIASGALTAVKKLGYKVPNDISICGFSSGIISEVTDPPLSSVNQNGFDIGMKAAELLINEIDSKGDIVYQSIVLPTQLDLKGSTK